MEQEKKHYGYIELWETVQKLEDFGSKNNSKLKKVFFDISENESYNQQIRDLATELMLYCEDDELGHFRMYPRKEILKEIATTLSVKS